MRSSRELVGWIVYFLIFGGMIFTVTVINAIEHAGHFTVGDWFGRVALPACVGLGVMSVPTTIAWRELRRRKRNREASGAS